MSKKRRMFDLELPEEETFPAGKTEGAEPIPDEGISLRGARPGAGGRRGPMAAAVQENADALRARAAQEAAIRAENDELARELVRLKKLGLIVDLVPIEAIDLGKLIRDRARGPDLELAELKASIRDVGLSNPIRVEPSGNGRYELVQGLRRLSAFRELFAETGEERFARIPAGLMGAGATLDELYRRMVDENLVRKDVSFAEMAELARAYAADPLTDCQDVDKAVAVLFQSAGYQKRSYIRAFAVLLERVGAYLKHPHEIPRNLGLDLRRRLDGDEARVVEGIRRDLQDWKDRGAQDELEVLRRWAGPGGGAAPGEGKAARSAPAAGARRAKVTFQLGRADGAAKCTAANGRLEIRMPLDFSTLDRRRLEAAVKGLLDALKEGR